MNTLTSDAKPIRHIERDDVDAVLAAAEQALKLGDAVASGQFILVPDVIVLECIANGVELAETGGITIDGGRQVLLYIDPEAPR